MKLTQSQLHKLIKEELEAVMNENRVTVDRDYEAERQTSIDAKRRAGVERRKKEKEADVQRKGSYYRHEPPDRAESYPGEFRARYMEEAETDPMDRLEAALETPGSVGTGRGIEVVKRHLGEIVGELVDAELDPQGPTRLDLDELAPQVHKMIMLHLEGQ